MTMAVHGPAPASRWCCPSSALQSLLCVCAMLLLLPAAGARLLEPTASAVLGCNETECLQLQQQASARAEAASTRQKLPRAHRHESTQHRQLMQHPQPQVELHHQHRGEHHGQLGKISSSQNEEHQELHQEQKGGCRRVLWFMALYTGASLDADYVAHLKVAIMSAKKNAPSLVPHVLVDGGPGPVTSWLEAAGVAVIHHELSIYGLLEEARNAGHVDQVFTNLRWVTCMGRQAILLGHRRGGR